MLHNIDCPRRSRQRRRADARRLDTWNTTKHRAWPRCRPPAARLNALIAVGAAAVLLALPAASAAAVVIEAEDAAGPDAEVFRDARASGGRSAGLLFEDGGKHLVHAVKDLPAGDYLAEFWFNVVPLEVLHHLGVTLTAGDRSVRLNQHQFDPDAGYHAIPLRFFHVGGALEISVTAVGGSGYDGMRKSLSEQEREAIAPSPTAAAGLDDDDGLMDFDDALDALEEDRNVQTLNAFDHRILCDKIVLTPLRTPPVLVTGVEVDKIHYAPGETVRASVQLVSVDGTHTVRLIAEGVTEIDDISEVYRMDLELDETPRTVAFEFVLPKREFGHKLRCTLTIDGEAVHSGGAFFGVSRNVYRIGITAPNGPQDMRNFSADDAQRLMQRGRSLYANYFERFAWAPCDYSELTPETEIFYSGQTQYPGSISGFKNLLNAAHEVGIKGITYGKACAAGIAGFETFQRFPHYFQHRPTGIGTEQFNTFYLERMLADDYLLHAPASEGGWSHWASLWTNWGRDDTVEFGAWEIVESARMFGWDGVRWDGHFVGNQKPFLDILNRELPEFLHGYNIAFANPGSKVFLPPANAVEDFHEVAANHGLMMDESVRDWSHSNFSPGYIRPFYEALCRQADYIKRIGGLPLIIVFDMASQQDRTINVLHALAAGQRYTYITSPGDFPFGPLPKFLTRYSAFVWDDTARIDNPEQHIRITAPDDAPTPWWNESAWLRTLEDGRQQLLLHILNAPNYNQFNHRVQTPPVTLDRVEIDIAPPDGARLVRATHVSPDLPDGHESLDMAAGEQGIRVTLPRLRRWSIVVVDVEGGPSPLYPLTTPVADAKEVLAERAEEKARQAREQQAKAGIGPSEQPAPPHYADFERRRNIDLEHEAGMDKPDDLTLARNGMLEVHHARGLFSWWNPVESATALCGNSRYGNSWIDYVGFKAGPQGCMDEFPDTYEELLGYDVLVLDNIHTRFLGPKRRVMIADFVRNGGGLLVFGGYLNLSMGADRNTYMEDLVPVRIRQFRDLAKDNAGMRLTPEDDGFFAEIDWSEAVHAFSVDTSPPADEARVLARAGGHPAIVAGNYGNGRVIAVMINPHGDPAEGRTPYWQWPEWPRMLTACLKWLGEDAYRSTTAADGARPIDPSKITPDDLLMEAFAMSSSQFTEKLQEAAANAVDARSARLLLEIAVDHVDKIGDVHLLPQLAEQLKPFADASFADFGAVLARNQLEFVREAGYKFIALSADPKYIELLTAGLRDRNTDVVREALAGLGNIGDPDAADAVHAYLREGSEKLLAHAVLLRMGVTATLPDALPDYEEALTRRVRLKSGRRSVLETLYGGVSFKLTREARRRIMGELRNVQKLEKQVQHDIRYFNDSVMALKPPALEPFFQYLTQTQAREVLPLAYAVIGNLSPEENATAVARFADAELPQLRLLAH